MRGVARFHVLPLLAAMCVVWGASVERATAQIACSNPVQIGACKAGCATNCLSPCVACPVGCQASRAACLVGCAPFFLSSCTGACNASFAACTSSCTNQCNLCTGGCNSNCDRLCVVCDAGGPYSEDCDGEETTVSLDGSGSFDPQGGPLTYQWVALCPDPSFDNPTISNPMLTIDTSPTCLLGCAVGLTVRDTDGGIGICGSTIQVKDDQDPVVHCPDPITLDRGDKICNDDVQNWLDSFTVEDNCTESDHILTKLDAPECGFAPGTTTTVTLYAIDECGNKNQCSSDITIHPLQRVSSDQKGSLLVFSKVEIRWDAKGNVIEDTFLDVSNDAEDGAVDVQAYFINGDIGVEEETDMNGNVVRTFEPGWNTADCRFVLTQNQPHFWSAAKGSSKCQPFSVLDMDGPGRVDPTAGDGSRVLHGFVVMWATRFVTPDVAGVADAGHWQEIRWNDLKGDAILVNYAEGSAWEYNAWAYQNTCVEHGAPILDCIERDKHTGVCCEAAPIPGLLPIDGFSYDVNFDTLLLDFYASGSTGLSRSGVTVMVDTELVLHAMDLDLRQDGEGPPLTKVEAEIFNENESKFSGTRRCICCWDDTDLSAYGRDTSIPNHFLRTKLGTNKGTARLDGVDSDECNYRDVCGVDPVMKPVRQLRPCPGRMPGTPLMGVAAKELTYTGAIRKVERAGSNLVGLGEESSVILHDVEQGTGELNTGNE